MAKQGFLWHRSNVSVLLALERTVAWHGLTGDFRPHNDKFLVGSFLQHNSQFLHYLYITHSQPPPVWRAFSLLNISSSMNKIIVLSFVFLHQADGLLHQWHYPLKRKFIGSTWILKIKQEDRMESWKTCNQTTLHSRPNHRHWGHLNIYDSNTTLQ